MTDAEILRAAATILERRTKRPKGIVFRAFVGTLRSVAADIDSGRR